MSIKEISNKDVIWSYLAQVFSVLSGLITLPLILKLLSTEEIGMNYLILTLGSLVSLFDFGFAPQFGRNITYIFSGSQKLFKEGVAVSDMSLGINYRLLATMILTAKHVYRRLAVFVLFVMLFFGSTYVYTVTNGFTNINHALEIWVVYSFSIFFKIYYSYYSALLLGKGLILESKKAMVYSKLVYVLLTFIFLYSDLGLFGVVLANLISPFVSRFISFKYFFTKDLNNKIKVYEISKEEKLELFRTIWHNAKKLGLVFIGSHAISKLSIFLAGLYLSLSDIASYGLMIQIFALLSTISGMIFSVYQPRFSSLRSSNNIKVLKEEFAFSMNIYYLTFIIGAFILIYTGPYLLTFIGSNAILPSKSILILFSIVVFLEGNHSNFATLIVTNNNVPFVTSSLVAGFFIGLGSFLSLNFTSYDILGLVLVQGLVQLAYANWKWPHVVCKEFKINFTSFLFTGLDQSISSLKARLYDR
jgi:O-antigen/teichoic acid export membrane protein